MKLSKKELTQTTLLILLVVLVYNFPWLYILNNPGYEQVFTGMIGTAKGDLPVYLSMIEQARQGKWLLANLYTSEFSRVGLLHPLWLGLGLLARWFDVSSISVFFWSKIYASALFLAVLFRFSTYWLTIHWQRMLFLLGLACAGGVGRWVSLTTQFEVLHLPTRIFEFARVMIPADLWISEGFVFMTLNHSSLFLLSQLGLVVAWWWAVVQPKKQLPAWGLAGLLLFLGLIHPYDLPIFWTVLVVFIVLYSVFGRQSWQPWVTFLLPSALVTVVVLAYFFSVFHNNPALSGWAEQNITLPPNWYVLWTGYGLLWLLSMLGVWRLFQQVAQYTPVQQAMTWLVISWYCTLPFLMYVPVMVGRRFINSFGIVIVLLSVIGLLYLLQIITMHIQAITKQIIVKAIVLSVIGLGTTLSPLVQIIDGISEVITKKEPVVMTVAQAEIITQIKSLPPEIVVLAPSFTFAMIIPSFTARRVYIGHGHQTIALYDKVQQTLLFYGTQYKTWKSRFIFDSGITHVIWEQARSQGFAPVWGLLYQNNSYRLYDVTPITIHE